MARCFFSLLYNTELVLIASAIRQEIEGIHLGKNKNTIIYVENPKESIKQQRELMSEFSKVTEYKVDTQNSYLNILTVNNYKLKF